MARRTGKHLPEKMNIRHQFTPDVQQQLPDMLSRGRFGVPRDLQDYLDAGIQQRPKKRFFAAEVVEESSLRHVGRRSQPVNRDHVEALCSEGLFTSSK